MKDNYAVFSYNEEDCLRQVSHWITKKKATKYAGRLARWSKYENQYTILKKVKTIRDLKETRW